MTAFEGADVDGYGGPNQDTVEPGVEAKPSELTEQQLEAVKREISTTANELMKKDPNKTTHPNGQTTSERFVRDNLPFFVQEGPSSDNPDYPYNRTTLHMTDPDNPDVIVASWLVGYDKSYVPNAGDNLPTVADADFILETLQARVLGIEQGI